MAQITGSVVHICRRAVSFHSMNSTTITTTPPPKPQHHSGPVHPRPSASPSPNNNSQHRSIKQTQVIDAVPFVLHIFRSTQLSHFVSQENFMWKTNQSFSSFWFRSKQQSSMMLKRRTWIPDRLWSTPVWTQPKSSHKAEQRPPHLNGRWKVCDHKHPPYILYCTNICSLLLDLKGPPEDLSADFQPRCSSSSHPSLRRMFLFVVLPSLLVTQGLSGHQLTVSKRKWGMKIHQRLCVCHPTKRQQLQPEQVS